jgi:hypothetical protein
MHRRQFLAASSAFALAARSNAQAPALLPAAPHDFYLLRRYTMQSGPQTTLTEHYFADALIPALNRLNLRPIGAFKLDIGPETPSFYLLIPSPNLETLATLDLHLAQDAAFLKAADPFWAAPAIAPAFLRVESSLLTSFEGLAIPIPPAPPAGPAAPKRIFQLRTYESPSFQDHLRKVEMFRTGGEIEIFRKAGFLPIFFGDTLIGPRQPSLTYMLTFADMTELNAKWDTFSHDPDWKKLSTSPRYGFESIVSNIANLILSPLACSQI